MKSFLQFLAALAVAVFFSLRHPLKNWENITGDLGLLWRWLRKRQRTPRAIYEWRMKACRCCPAFYAPLATCGTPLKKDFAGLGCWCYLPIKNGLYDADCWIREQDGATADTGGWPDSLRHPDNVEVQDGAAPDAPDVQR